MSLITIISSLSCNKGAAPDQNDFDTILLIKNGESNSGGYALNTSATSAELLQRSSIKILKSTTLLFEDLHIGVNNNTDHFGLNSTTHGWELQIANKVEQGFFPGKSQLHLVETGQGASLISQWSIGDTYSNKFIERYNAAKNQLQQANKRFFPVILYSQGINDAIANTNVATWKQATIQHIADVRSLTGAGTYFLATKLMSPTYDTYNTALAEIAASDSKFILIETTGATLRDTNHWDYAGMKLIGDRMSQKIVELFF